jgi:phosphoglycolate phosphatase
VGVSERRDWLFLLDAIVFDLDGTLVELTIDFGQMRAEVIEIVERHAVAVDAHRQGLFTLELIADVTAELNWRSPQQAARFAAEAHAAIEAIEVEAAQRADLFPGVPELLTWLWDRGLELGIITRNCRAAAGKVLESLSPLVGVVLTRDDVPAVKPDPLHLRRALETLGVPGERALMVGDHPLDVVTGRAVGAFTAGVLRPGETPDRYAAVAPDLVLASVLELQTHLEVTPGVDAG